MQQGKRDFTVFVQPQNVDPCQLQKLLFSTHLAITNTSHSTYLSAVRQLHVLAGLPGVLPRIFRYCNIGLGRYTGW